MVETVIEELRAELDRSTLQVIAVEDSSKRYSISPAIITEVLKYLVGEFLIGLLALEAMARLSERLHAAGALARRWVRTGLPPSDSEQADVDAALDEAYKAARAHARTEADLRAASARVETVLREAGAGPTEIRDVLESLNGVLARSWTK